LKIREIIVGKNKFFKPKKKNYENQINRKKCEIRNVLDVFLFVVAVPS
jgi:hypothetical protein